MLSLKGANNPAPQKKNNEKLKKKQQKQEQTSKQTTQHQTNKTGSHLNKSEQLAYKAESILSFKLNLKIVCLVKMRVILLLPQYLKTTLLYLSLIIYSKEALELWIAHLSTD